MGRGLLSLFLSPSSVFSLYSLFAALCLAIGWELVAHGRRDVKLSVLWRGFFPRRLTRSASTRADLFFVLLNVALAGSAIGLAVLSSKYIGAAVDRGLISAFGRPQATGLPDWAARALATLVLFLAYELAYWTDHWASHRVPILWAFHRVHHTAEVLSPITNFRVHPVDSIVFGNFLAVFTGVALGVLQFALGASHPPFNVGSVNFLILAFTYFTVHLQHSHFWIPVTGPLGRLLMSPAHHQLHHSDDPAHHNSNFGSCLSLWDWMFGTLVMPERKRQRLTFGAGPALAGNHTVWGVIGPPFAAAWRTLRASPATEPAVVPGEKPSPVSAS